jgi:regulatory protein
MKRNTSAPDQEKAVLFRKAADYCAVQDRCLSEMRQKLLAWGSSKEDAEPIVSRLVEEGFIDEQRFASAFARGKFHNLQWGKIKIVAELHRRNISNILIVNAVDEIDEGEYLETLTKLMHKKTKELRPGTVENRFKVMRFLAGKGFEPEWIRKVMKADF